MKNYLNRRGSGCGAGAANRSGRGAGPINRFVLLFGFCLALPAGLAEQKAFSQQKAPGESLRNPFGKPAAAKPAESAKRCRRSFPSASEPASRRQPEAPRPDQNHADASESADGAGGQYPAAHSAASQPPLNKKTAAGQSDAAPAAETRPPSESAGARAALKKQALNQLYHLFSYINSAGRRAWEQPLQVMLLQNFLKGNITGETAYFILKEDRLDAKGQHIGRAAVPGRIIKETGPGRARAEIIVDGSLKTVEINMMSADTKEPPAANPSESFLHAKKVLDVFRERERRQADPPKRFLHALEESSPLKRPLRTALQGSPDLGLAFKAIKSKTESIDFLPSPKQIRAIKREKERLTALGYGPAFLRGFEELMEGLLLREALIDGAANPRASHIEYFARKAPELIAHARAGIQDGGVAAAKGEAGAADLKAEALKKLNLIESQAAEAISKKQASYAWWVGFFASLARALSPPEKAAAPKSRNARNYDRHVQELINVFPSQMLMPLASGTAGVLAMNMAGARGVHAIGLINKPEMADGKLMSPMEFAAHDIEHTHPFVYDLMGLYSGEAVRRLYLKFEAAAELGLPAGRRKNFETVYLLQFHQGLGISRPLIFKPPNKKNLSGDISEDLDIAYKFKFPFKGLANVSDSDAAQRKRRFESVAADFVETALMLESQAAQ